MQERMHEFISWLESDLTHFVALVEEGSTVAGDPWQEGFSDHDITIVINQDQESEMAAVYAWLKAHPFDNSYLFGPRLADEFVHGSTLNDISMKFRAKTVAGKDVVAEKDLPDRNTALEIGMSGLQNLEMRCVRRLLNLAHWTLPHTRKKNYDIFKNFFVLAAAKLYGETGQYPTTRTDVANVLSSQHNVAPLLHATNNIITVTKEEQKEAFESAIEYIRTLDN